VNVREGLFNAEMRMIENDLTPFGQIVDGTEEETEIMGGDLWYTMDREKTSLL
jgi:hypothetical protein